MTLDSQIAHAAKFVPGARVRCIEGDYKDLIAGHVYYVDKVAEGGTTISLAGFYGSFAACRFELVKDEPVTSQNTASPWTIEPHGSGFALYSGRSANRHGMNLVYMSEPDCNWNGTKALIEQAPRMLNLLKQLVEVAPPSCPVVAEALLTIAIVEAAQ